MLVACCVALAACASVPREPWVLDSSSLTTPASRRTDWLDSYPRALAATLDVLERDLGLPRVQVRLVFLPDRPTFEALLREIGYTPTLARDASDQMIAVGGHRHILINQERLEGRRWPDRIGLLAHELGHVLQYEWGGGVRGESDQWLREGYADWLEIEVLDALTLVDAKAAHRSARDLLREELDRGPLPSLESLMTFSAWVDAGRGGRGGALYNRSLVAVKFLIDRHGHDAVVEYFRLFSRQQDRSGNFRKAFGEDVRTFEAAFDRYVTGSGR